MSVNHALILALIMTLCGAASCDSGSGGGDGTEPKTDTRGPAPDTGAPLAVDTFLPSHSAGPAGGTILFDGNRRDGGS